MIIFVIGFLTGVLSAAGGLAYWAAEQRKARATSDHRAEVLRRREIKVTHGFNLIRAELEELKRQLSGAVALPSPTAESAHGADGDRAASHSLYSQSYGASAVGGGPVL
jgi:pantothenate kinase-related protein Tda10